MSPSMFRAAIIGMGVMGRNHYRALKGHPCVSLAGICDTALSGQYEEPTYSSVDELLDAVSPDMAVIAVPTPAHAEIAAECMRHNVNLLVEKPVASTVEQALRLGEQSGSRSIKVAVGHIERFNPVVRSLRNELEGKEIFSINICRIGPLPPRIGDVGVLVDLAVHDIDLMRFVSGKEIVETTIYKSRKIQDHFDDNAVLSFQMTDEVVGSITTNWLTPFKKRYIEVATREAYYEADLMSQELIEYSGYKDTRLPFYRDDARFVTRHCPVRKGEPLIAQTRAFVEYLDSGNRGLLATIEDSLLTLKVLGL